MEAARQALIESNRSVEALQTFDIFDMDDGDIQEATMKAMERHDMEAESNMAIMYFWSVQKLNLLSPAGVLIGEDPAPLTADQVEVVVEAIMDHDNYQQGQSVVYRTSDGQMVTGQGGQLTTEAVPT